MDDSKAGLVCSAKGCKNKSYFCKKKSFFRFPVDPIRARKWAVACRREDLLPKMCSLYKGYRLCADHFDSKMFTNKNCNRLNHNAVPTIFPALEESSRYSYPALDHSYSLPRNIHLDKESLTPIKCEPNS